MTVDAISATTLPGQQGSLSASESQDLSDSFLQLLVAQLKNQDPLNPQDGAEFMQELVNLSTFQELVQIRTLLETSAADAAALKPQVFGQQQPSIPTADPVAPLQSSDSSSEETEV